MKTVIANWKSNPNSLREAARLAKSIEKHASLNRKAEVVIAPPFIYLSDVKKEVSTAKLGAQDVFGNEGGAYTGAINLAQLKNTGVKYVIIGHSERRRYFGETDEFINKKVTAALAYGFKIVLCVGNKEKMSDPSNFVNKQLTADLKGVSSKDKIRNLIVAYEPIWAIGTGNADNPQSAAEVSLRIKEHINKLMGVGKIKVLYGGSVTDKNIRSFISRNKIDGVLVGGASLNPSMFGRIIKAANELG
ncbi:MAG: triose-phosphate isomerase [Patescibacteria group bacterium]|nr:triose-phosphate isomerase [Patescibacteria group bacterium]MDE2144370.1 triose-phosphate isomerase [Patescibacteria group bacterium]